MSPTVIPQVARPAVSHENDRDLLPIQEAEDQITMPVRTAEPLDEGEQMAADLVAAKAKYALGLYNFHQLGSGAAILHRRGSEVSTGSNDTVETPIL